MMRFLSFLFVALLCVLPGDQLKAQWGIVTSLLSQADSNTVQNFSSNQTTLNANFEVDHTMGNVVWGNLLDALGGNNPGGGIDQGYLDDVSAGYDLLNELIPNLGLSQVDEDTLLGEAQNVFNIFNNNTDSLGNILNTNGSDLSFDSSNWSLVILGFDGMADQQFGVLQDSMGMSVDLSNPSGIHNLKDLIGSLFDATMFPDLELAFGTQVLDLNYWELPYSREARLIRLGSVPRFQKLMDGRPDGILRLPIEPRWHVEASWTNTREPTLADPAGKSGNREFTPLLLDGDFAMMAIPVVGRWGNTVFRMITSVGMEFGTYAPSHSSYAPPFTLPNRGFATGFGPQMGAGFAMVTGDLIIYSYGTMAHGDMFRTERGYKFNSKYWNAGIRYGNIVNVRYRMGEISWQPLGNRTAKLRHELTVGIILSELHH